MTFGLALDFRRRAFGDLSCRNRARDALADAHDDFHVVLDEQHGDAEFFLGEPDQLHQFDLLRRVHAGGGFVEQQQLRPRGEGADDFEPALVAVGQALARQVALGSRGRRFRATP